MTDKKKVENMDETDIQLMIVRVEKSIGDLKAIGSDEEMNIVANSRSYVKRIMKRIDQLFDPITKKIRESLQTARDQKALLYDPYAEADRVYSRSLSAYLTEKTRKKEEEERKIREEEARAKRKQEKKFEEALRLENEGRKAQANAVFQEVEEIEEKIEEKAPVPTSPDLQHGHMRAQWNAEIYNEKIIPRKYFNLDIALLNRTARAQQDKMRIPGVRAVKTMIPVDSRK